MRNGLRRNAAAAAGLGDRGEIAPEKRAGFITDNGAFATAVPPSSSYPRLRRKARQVIAHRSGLSSASPRICRIDWLWGAVLTMAGLA
jgi:hypothetical protein